MATINELPIKDISQMTEEELLAHILAVRQRRREPTTELKVTAKAKAIKKKNKSAALQSTDELLKGVSSAQAAEILRQIREGKK